MNKSSKALVGYRMVSGVVQIILPIILALLVLIGIGYLAFKNNLEVDIFHQLKNSKDVIEYTKNIEEVQHILNSSLLAEFNKYEKFPWKAIAKKFPDNDSEWIVEWSKGENECNQYFCYMRVSVGGQITLPLNCGVSYCK